MSEANFPGSDKFEPPKYLSSLIAAVNDGAKAAQAGGLLFALVGVYLLATAFSASDEDLLRGRAVTISQIGASLPVSFSYAIAPFVFVFLHVYTLARYHMLGANVQQFTAELKRTVPIEADRERCRHLLSNVEFIQALVAPVTSRLYSPAWRWLVLGVVAGFPVFVLLLVQINALRYQSTFIVWVQRVWLFTDLAALVSFFHSNPLERPRSQPYKKRGPIWHWVTLLWLPVSVISLNLLYLNVVPIDANEELVRYQQFEQYGPRPVKQSIQQYLANAFVFDNPMDVVLCYQLQWGCRYLRLDHRTLIDHVWDDKAIVELRSGSSEKVHAALTAIEGVVLRDRSFRFAVLDESSLFAADLTGSDLGKALLSDARLPQARLKEAQLHGANLSGADLRSASLAWAQLQGADLTGAQLQGANLIAAQLQGADLRYAQLQGANLLGAQVQGADLTSAKAQGAAFIRARLQGADLSGAQLQGADLSYAQMRGATFGRSPTTDLDTNLELSDLRNADFTTPMPVYQIHAALDAIPADKDQARKHLSGLLVDRPLNQIVFNATPEKQVLVSDPASSIFKDTPKNWLITSPTPPYTNALVGLLADDLTPASPAIAIGIIARTSNNLITASRVRDVLKLRDDDRALYSNIACRLIANFDAGKIALHRGSIDYLSEELQQSKINCEAIKPAVP